MPAAEYVPVILILLTISFIKYLVTIYLLRGIQLKFPLKAQA